jgi:hypothetical protein
MNNKSIDKSNDKMNNKSKENLNEDDEELFYNEFGYEPDEQKLEVQQKVIQPIKKERSWVSFYEEYKNNCIIINDIIDIENAYLKNIDKYLI